MSAVGASAGAASRAGCAPPGPAPGSRTTGRKATNAPSDMNAHSVAAASPPFDVTIPPRSARARERWQKRLTAAAANTRTRIAMTMPAMAPPESFAEEEEEEAPGCTPLDDADAKVTFAVASPRLSEAA